MKNVRVDTGMLAILCAIECNDDLEDAEVNVKF